MAASIIDILREETRQALTGDDKYFTKRPYAFVVNGPSLKGPLGLTGTAVFPMPLNPDRFEYTLPFAVEITPLQEGGIVSEEGGIVIGDIVVSATTGWKLKPSNDTSFGPGDGEFTGLMPAEISHFQDLSGQMHFWRLMGRCFDGYSALKKDAKTASQTTMEFHSLKDDLHLQVVPREVKLDRSAAGQRVTYNYTVHMSVVGPATTDIDIPSPDVGLLQSFKNTISKMRAAVQSIRAGIDDVTAALDEIRRTITSVASILDDVASIADAASDFVSGVVNFVNIPKAFMQSAVGLVESAANFAATVASFPADVAQTFRVMADDIDRIIVASGENQRDTFAEVASNYERLSRPLRPGEDDTKDIAAADIASKTSGGLTTFPVSEIFGLSVRPGDVSRRTISTQRTRTRLNENEFQGFEEHVVSDGDTLQSLAAKHLGGANKWLDIAAANNLRPPFLTGGARIPGTLHPGARFIVPLRQARTRPPDTITTGTAKIGESQMEAWLGTDFELVQVKNASGALTGTFGFAINTPGGGTDVRRVRGVKNMTQAIGSRFRTEQGHNILYPAIGLPRLIGRKKTGEQLVEARFEARGQLLADVRVETLRGFRFTDEDDALVLEATVQLAGFATSRVISQTLT